MSSAKKKEFQKKTVTFNGETLELYSLDGYTWSTRKEELLIIQERHEADKVTFQEIRSGIVQKKGASEQEEKKKPTEAKAKKTTPKKTAPKKKATSRTAAKKTTSKKAATKKTAAKKASPKKRTTTKKKTTARKKNSKAA